MTKFIYLLFILGSAIVLATMYSARRSWKLRTPQAYASFSFYLFVVVAVSAYTFWQYIHEFPYVADQRVQEAEQYDQPIHIAAVWTSPSDGFFAGAKLAVRQINEAGGVKLVNGDGAPIRRKVILETVLSEASFLGEAPYRSVAYNPKNMAVIGSTDKQYLVTAPVAYNEAGLLYLASMDNNPLLTSYGMPFVLATMPNNILQAQRLADFCEQNGLKRILAVQALDPENAVMVKRLGTALYTHNDNKINDTDPKDRLEIVASHSYPVGKPDFQEFVTNLQNISFDAIYLADQPTRAATFIRELRRQGLGQPVLGISDFDTPALLGALGEWSDNIYVTSVYADEAVVQGTETMSKFHADYQAYSGKPANVLSAQSYESIQILAQAWERSGTVRPAVTTATLRAFKGWDGLYGKYDFNENGAVNDRPIFIKRSQQGKYALINGSNNARSQKVVHLKGE